MSRFSSVKEFISEKVDAIPVAMPGGTVDKAVRTSLKVTLALTGIAFGATWVVPTDATALASRDYSKPQKVSMVALRMSGNTPQYHKSEVVAEFSDILACERVLESYLAPEESKNPISKWGIKSKKDDPRQTVKMQCTS